MELPQLKHRPIHIIISKCYSDVIVRMEGSRCERIEIYSRVKNKLFGSDHLLAWMAAKFNIRLSLMKDIIRKTKTLIRLIKLNFKPNLIIRKSL